MLSLHETYYYKNNTTSYLHSCSHLGVDDLRELIYVDRLNRHRCRVKRDANCITLILPSDSTRGYWIYNFRGPAEEISQIELSLT